MQPYGVISDTHNHGWSAFAHMLPSGVNSRLQIILDETKRAADAVRAAGGKTLVHAGDLFHVRGSIAPSVLNPTLELYKSFVDDGMKVIILAGNHDLEGREAARVSSAITALEGVGCNIVNEETVFMPDSPGDAHLVLIPWTPSVEALKVKIASVKDQMEKMAMVSDGIDIDLIIHAPVDGVIPGLPDHGLSGEWLAKQGFRFVLSGHYHHHRHLGGNVYSIGASTHQTWGDIGTKAGFLLVDDSVHFNASHAPEFVEIDASVDPTEIPLLVDGNYVRAKINSAKVADVESLRTYLESSGAKGVTILSQKESAAAVTRSGATVKAGETLEGSVNSFIKDAGMENASELGILCADILSTARSAVECP